MEDECEVSEAADAGLINVGVAETGVDIEAGDEGKGRSAPGIGEMADEEELGEAGRPLRIGNEGAVRKGCRGGRSIAGPWGGVMQTVLWSNQGVGDYMRAITFGRVGTTHPSPDAGRSKGMSGASARGVTPSSDDGEGPLLLCFSFRRPKLNVRLSENALGGGRLVFSLMVLI